MRRMPDPEQYTPKPRRLLDQAGRQDNQSARADASAATPPIEQDPFYPAFWQNVVEASSVVPQGDEPAYWPVHVLHELDHIVTYRKSANYTPEKAAFADKLAPIKESIRNIKLAYSIIAYPHCKLSQTSISVRVQDQFGQGYARLRDFRRAFCEVLTIVHEQYRRARVTVDERGLTLHESHPPVAGVVQRLF